MKKAFITGGAGFIGSHLAKELLEKGVSVTAYDDLSTGDAESVPEGATLICEDVRHSRQLHKAMEGHDTVFHLAAHSLIGTEGTGIGPNLYSNVIGTINVMEAARELGIRDLIFSSSGAVYGDEEETIFSEKFGPLLPISMYGASKVSAEAFVSAYSALFGIEACIFRFSNVVGGGMNRGVIFDFVNKLRANPKELEIWGDGQQARPYFLVEDCIRGMILAHQARKEAELPGRLCEVFNLGCPNATSVDRVAEIVIKEMGLNDVLVRHTGGRSGFPGDVPRMFCSVDKMESLGWRVSRTSDEAVRIAARRIIKGER